MRQPLIEFLIPGYKRPAGAATAAKSVVQQMLADGLEEKVGVRIVDDASPNQSAAAIISELGTSASHVRVEVNTCNKGMSLNIFDMVRTSASLFCTVLTDDDWLQPGSLRGIVDYIEGGCKMHERSLGGFFTPRYSYLEDGTLDCIVCRTFPRDTVIRGNPLNSVKYCHNGFILTGFVFRPENVNYPGWLANIDNSFFPVLYFGWILARHDVAFLDRNWFRHTVHNVCHWDAWGEDASMQRKRLYRDYMDAVTLLTDNALKQAASVHERLKIRKAEVEAYLFQFRASRTAAKDRGSGVTIRTSRRLAFKLAMLLFVGVDVVGYVTDRARGVRRKGRLGR